MTVNSGPGTITLQEAADRLGVHYMTAYRYIRQGRLPATREVAAWKIRTVDLDALRGPSTKPARRGAARARADAEGLERRMLAGDGPGAWWVVKSQLEGGLDPTGAVNELIIPALRSIGERWARGDASVADEHRATAVAERLVGHLGLQFGRRGKSRGVIALAAPSGDLHTLPVSIVADLLRWRAFEVLELGGNTPADALADAVTRSGPPPGGRHRLDHTRAGDRSGGVGALGSCGGARCHHFSRWRPRIRSEAHALELGGDVWTGLRPNAAVETVENIAGSISGAGPQQCRLKQVEYPTLRPALAGAG